MDVDTLYLNGTVVTADPDFSIGDGFAVRGDRFVAVGAGADLRRLAGPRTRIVDLAGRTVLPGLIDAHPHVVHRGLAGLARPDLAGADSVAEIARRIGARAADLPAGSWIVASPLGEPPDFTDLPERWAERRWPTRADLDAVAPDHPVHIPTSAYWPHPAVFNGAALALLGITRDTGDEPGIRIERDTAGEPTGLVHGLHIYRRDSRLFRAVAELLPVHADEDRRDAIKAAMHDHAAVGVTTLYEAHANFWLPDLRALHGAGRLPVRVIAAPELPAGLPDVDGWIAERADALGAGSGDDMLWVRGATVSMDGAAQFGLALMSGPYLGPDGEPGNGTAAVSEAELVRIARAAVRHDLRLNLMAAGDEASAIVLRALRTLNAETRLAGRRWVLQHVFHPTRDQVATARELGLVVQTYTSVDHSKGGEVFVRRMGGDIWRDVAPLAWWREADVPVAQSSDGGHIAPAFQIWASLRRTDGRTGRSLLTPAKRISRRTAIRQWTSDSAFVLAAEDRIGSIEPGKLADFAVLDRDILACPEDDIRSATVVRTEVGGVPVHDTGALAG